jgi:hypothetical protein
MHEEVIKVWCTKWALTQGIFEVTGYNLGMGMFQVLGNGASFSHYYLHGEGKDWHRTEASALERAAKMADKKLEALKRQIKKLEKDRGGFFTRIWELNGG